MKGKQIAVTILVGVTAFAAGFLLRESWEDSTFDSVQTGGSTNQAAQGSPSSSQGHVITQEPDNSSVDSLKKEDVLTADMIQIRIDDGQVQWHDGTLWHTVASVEELSGEDKFYLALEPFLAFSQELQQEKAKAQTDSWQAGTFMAEENGLSVGQKETPKPTPKPSATPRPSSETAPPAQDPEPADTTPSAPTPSVPTSGAPASSAPTPSTPAPSTQAPSTPAPSTPAPSESNSGDGEDIDADDAWSDLVL